MVLGSVSALVLEALPIYRIIYRRGCLVLGGVRHGHQVLVCVPSAVVHGSWICVRSYDL